MGDGRTIIGAHLQSEFVRVSPRKSAKALVRGLGIEALLSVAQRHFG